MIGMLAPRNNLRVKNAKQQVKRKAIFIFRSGTQKKKTYTHTHINIEKNEANLTNTRLKFLK